MRIVLGPVDRILVLGGSNSGKTYLARKLVRSYPRVLVFDPSGTWVKDHKGMTIVNSTLPKEFLRVTEQAMRQGNLLYVLEDVDVVMDRYELWREDKVRELFIVSRHKGVAWIVICRRTADIPTLVEKQANKVFIFWTDNRHDLKYIEDTFGPEAADEVRGLDPNRHEFLFINREDRTRARGVA